MTAGTSLDGLVDRLLDAGAIHPHHVASPYGTGDVTVVVPAFVLGESALAEIVRRCPGVAAVIAIDDASEPPVHAVDGARVLRLRTNAGPAVARNAGLGAVDDPTRRLRRHRCPPAAGLAGPPPPPLRRPSGRPRRATGRQRPRRRPGGRLRAAATRRSTWARSRGGSRPGTRLSYVPAAAIVVRTDALRAIGGFDRTLRFGEDVDAVWRLVEAGWRCRYEPAVVVHHRPRGSWRGLIAQRISYGSSAAPLAKRHRGALAPVRMSGWSGAVWFLVLTGHPVLALAVAGGTAGALVRKLPGVPAATSLRLAAMGHLHAGRLLADAGRRAWWPLLLAGAAVSRRVRRIAVLTAVPALMSGGLPRLVDDLAYGVGVWRGMIAERDPAPIVPRFTSWPGRTRSAGAGGDEAT